MRSGSGHCATGKQRRKVTSANSAMPNPHVMTPAANAENGFGVMPRRRSALGAGVESDRHLDILMAEELPHDLILPGVAVQKNLCRRMAEPVRRHVEPRVGVDEFFNLAAKRTISLVPIRRFAGKQERAGPDRQQRTPFVDIDTEEFYRVRHQWKFEVIAVFHLGRWKTQVDGASFGGAHLQEMLVKPDRGQVLNADGGIEEQLDRERGLDHLCLPVTRPANRPHLAEDPLW